METTNLQANNIGTSLVVTSDDDTSDLATLCNQSGLNSFSHTPTPHLALQSTTLTNNIPIPTSFPCLSPTSSASMLIDAGFLMDRTLGFQQQITSATSSSASHMQITEHSSVVPSAAPLFQLSNPTILINSSDKPLQKPRLPTSSYSYFIQERRELYRTLGTPVKFTDFSKECSNIWAQMPAEEKDRFKSLASEDKKRYQKELEAYKQNEIKVEKRGRKKRQPGHPKRNMSAFLFFSAEKRPQLKNINPQATVGDNSKHLSEAWKHMTDEEKAPYVEMADRDKVRYDQQKVAYTAGLEAGYRTRVQSDTLLDMSLEDSEKPVKKKDPSMPKRSMSAFMFFSQDKRPELRKSNPNTKVSVLSKILSEAWKKLTPFQRATYETMANADKERYQRQISSYKNGKKERNPLSGTL